MALDLDGHEVGVSWVPTFAAWTLSGGRSTVARARALLRDGLAGRGFHGEALAEGELMGCELVTNAVRHACPPFELRRLADLGAVICEIVDGRRGADPGRHR